MIRRMSFVLAFLLLLATVAPLSAATQSATETISRTVDVVLSIIKKPEMNDPAHRPEYFKQIEDHIKTIFDFTEFSARTVGPKWQSFTPEQKSRFEEAFASLLRATYIEKLEGYSGEKVEFTNEILGSKGDRAEVQSTLQMKDKSIPVAYRLLEKNNEWKIYDVRIENVSLIETYRGQLKDILRKGSAEDLIKTVEEKALQVKNENNTVTQ